MDYNFFNISWRKAMTNLDSILKSRDVTLLTKIRLVKAMVFPVVMCGCESWTKKKAKHWRIDAFELWCWRRLLRIPWTARRSNQSILKEISPELWPPDVKIQLIRLGKIKDRRRRGDRGQDFWMASLTQWTWVWAGSGSWWRAGKPGVMQSFGSHDWVTEQ